MNLFIEPLLRCGPLDWSMTQEQVNLVLGEPEKASKNGVGNWVQFRRSRSMALVFAASSGKLVEVSCSKEEPALMLGDLKINGTESDRVVRELLQRDEAWQGYGSLVFPKLGVALTGYVPEDQGIRAASVFAAGRWDDAMSGMKRFRPRHKSS